MSSRPFISHKQRQSYIIISYAANFLKSAVCDLSRESTVYSIFIGFYKITVKYYSSFVKILDINVYLQINLHL